MYNSTNFLRLTFGQYGKAFGLPHFIPIDWKTYSILYALVKLVFPLTYITFWFIAMVLLLSYTD